MPKVSSYCLDGALPLSTRTWNKQLSSNLPSPNSPLCQALYDFIRLILDIKKPSKWPSPPSSQQVAQFNAGSCGDTSEEGPETIAFSGRPLDGNMPLYRRKKALHESNQTTFLALLDKLKFPHPCFNWNKTSSSSWNQAFSRLILQHWNRSRLAGAFLPYPMDPEAAANTSTISDLITRWFNGRRDLIRKEQQNPGSSQAQKKLVWKSHWRRTLAIHRTETLESLKLPDKYCTIFEDTLCNSETESLEDGTLVKVALRWRSKMASLLATRVDRLTIQRKLEEKGRAFGSGQLLETRRQLPTRNQDVHQESQKQRVPQCLPLDFYNKQFYESFGTQAQQEMCSGSPLDLSDLWFLLDRDPTHS
ncbi:hypothetical protein PCASD_06858 [Puccinia coronata f. sp. avenae]|uniref:Uncharacterized protein n=1 Tax=Puccinia coronata f. sp. avenae TaxID=200324 RepID=A0A2N5UYD6_9BASI|nr:hypothetical protein PCASD_06858 [Puccinia coronata f. sp. avenae]